MNIEKDESEKFEQMQADLTNKEKKLDDVMKEKDNTIDFVESRSSARSRGRKKLKPWK